MKTIITDGRTKTSINALPEEAWTYLRGEQEDGGLKKLQKEVPWLFRGLQIRMNSVSSIPFVLYKGDEEYDTSDNWQNKLGWWDNPRRTIMMAEGALTLFGKSYFFKNPSLMGNYLGLQYWFPASVKPIITENEGLIRFDRTLRQNTEPKPYDVEDVLYIWAVDPYVEIGPPTTSPATAALAAAGVLWNVDDFASAFFERGAIKATILSVPQGTLAEERSRLRTWWQRAVQGKNFATEVVNADAVRAETIGEGIKELENVELTKEKREDIATALGIPQSIMFSTAATDTNRTEDEQALIEHMAKSECRLLEESFNSQVFAAMGMRLKFMPESLGIYQEDEGERSLAFLNYVSATGKDKASFWAGFLGIELPVMTPLEVLDSEPMPNPFMSDPKDLRDDTKDDTQGKKDEERKQFARWAKKREPKDWKNFTFNHLDEDEQIALIGQSWQNNATEPDDKTELVKMLTELIDIQRGIHGGGEINVYNTMPEVQVSVPEREVTVNVPEQKAPEIKNEVNIPEQKQVAPIVNITNEVEPTPVIVENKIDVDIPEPKPRKTRVKRDDYGNITEMETE